MFSLNINRTVIYKIDKFIESYLNSGLNLFVDSGIDNVETINDFYKNNAKNFRNKIYSNINNIFSENKILGYKNLDNYKIETRAYIGNFVFIITYSEEISDKIRLIEDIEIFRKN